MTDAPIPVTDWRIALRDARRYLMEAQVIAAQVSVAQKAAFAALERAIEGAFQEGVQTLPLSTAHPTDHRRAHRPGKLAKLDADPELRAFVVARLDRLTFDEIAADVTAHFPPTRRIGKSAIHAWWQNNRPKRRMPDRRAVPDNLGTTGKVRCRTQ